MGVTIIKFARIGFGMVNQVFQGFKRQAWVHQQHIGARVHVGQMDEISHRVVFQIRVQTMRHGVLAYACLDDGVAVGSRFARTLSPHHTARTADVFYDHRLLQNFAQFVIHHAPHHIAGAARWEWHDQLDRFTRVIALSRRIYCT